MRAALRDGKAEWLREDLRSPFESDHIPKASTVHDIHGNLPSIPVTIDSATSRLFSAQPSSIRSTDIYPQI